MCIIYIYVYINSPAPPRANPNLLPPSGCSRRANPATLLMYLYLPICIIYIYVYRNSPARPQINPNIL